MFDDEVFAPPNLTSPEALSRLYIEPGCNQLPLPTKSEWDDVPVFRSVMRSLYGWAEFNLLICILLSIDYVNGGC